MLAAKKSKSATPADSDRLTIGELAAYGSQFLWRWHRLMMAQSTCWVE